MPKDTFWCDHPKTRLVYKVFSNGGIHYYRQCCLCLKPATDWISHKAIGNERLSAIQDDQDGLGLILPKNDLECRELRLKIRAYGLQRYSANYLATPAWKQKHDQVMLRDSKLCRVQLAGCTVHATEVHHLSYANVPNEPIDQLIAICHACHEAITKESVEDWLTI